LLVGSPAWGQARTQAIEAQLALVRTAESKAQPLIARMTELATANQKLRGEFDQNQAYIDGLQPRRQAYERDLGRYDREVHAYEQRVKVFNSRCSGTLSDDKFRPCLNEKGDIAGARIELDKARDQLAATKAKLEDEIRALRSRQSAAARQMKENLDGWEAAQKEYRTIFQSVDGARKILADLCAAGEAERDAPSVRLCVSLGWDNEKRDFSGLVDLPPPTQ
jgi:chromosome segregation ATPase